MRLGGGVIPNGRIQRVSSTATASNRAHLVERGDFSRVEPPPRCGGILLRLVAILRPRYGHRAFADEPVQCHLRRRLAFVSLAHFAHQAQSGWMELSFPREPCICATPAGGSPACTCRSADPCKRAVGDQRDSQFPAGLQYAIALHLAVQQIYSTWFEASGIPRRERTACACRICAAL